MTTKAEIIKTLSQVDVSKFVQQKMGLSYLSWANAWATLLQYYPNSTYEFKEFDEFLPNKENEWKCTGRTVDYRLTSSGCEVVATVTIEGQEFTMSLYVMDNRNRVVRVPDYGQINKTQQRCLVKALALAGLGLNLYQGEDLPVEENMKRKGINPEMLKAKQELEKEKKEYARLFAELKTRSKQNPAEIQMKIEQEAEAQYPAKANTLDKFKIINDVLRKMLKEQGKDSEQIELEEV